MNDINKQVEDFLSDEPVNEIKVEEPIVDWQNEPIKKGKVKLSKLKEHPLNKEIYNNLDDEDFTELKASMSKRLQNPIVINKDYVILAGNRRFRAAKELNWDEIDTITKQFETEDEEIYFLITDNKYRVKVFTEKIREAKELDRIESENAKNRQIRKPENSVVPILAQQNAVRTREIVAEQIGIKRTNYDKLKQIVKKSDEIEDKTVSKFLEKIANQESVDAAHKLSKETPEFIKQVKDKVDSGHKYHSIVSVMKEAKKETYFNNKETNYEFTDSDIKIYNDDCRTILTTLEDNSIDLLLTDPPYGIDYTPTWSPEKNFADDSPEYVEVLMHDCLKLWQSKLKKDAHLYIFTGWGSYPWLQPIIAKYFEISNVLVWVKNQNSLCDFDKRYAFQYELIVFAKQLKYDGQERLLRHKEGTRLTPDVLNFSRCTNQIHGCEKPIDLLEFLINNSTSKGETVLDCFAGTFNSALATMNTERKYIGIEKDQKWFNIGLQKINENK